MNAGLLKLGKVLFCTYNKQIQRVKCSTGISQQNFTDLIAIALASTYNLVVKLSINQLRSLYICHGDPPPSTWRRNFI